jgi:hypothetical protein
MSISLSMAARNAAGDAVVTSINNGSALPNGYIEIRDGLRPAGPQSTATGKLLAKLQLSNPAFRNFSNGSSQANPVANDSEIDNTGIASWFRIFNRNSVAVIDGDVTVTGGGGDIQFDNINFTAGGIVSISAIIIRMS